ncbi:MULTISPECIES: hypothetical protein [unclassified Coleofasciculus]|uniref:hypothetical protein n=1 Tax=unclassified Coleofasciculus TaxID=2692782 RepID=UPI001D13D057|nr:MULTISPECIES: hypothetical protein [unclassified Coleofasciculus]
MPRLNFDTSKDPTADKSLASDDIERLIGQLENSHALLYKTINLETGALVETMDRLVPGFWSRFLENRRRALKQFLQNKQSEPF